MSRAPAPAPRAPAPPPMPVAAPPPMPVAAPPPMPVAAPPPMAAPPATSAYESVYEEAWAVITTVNPAFSGPGAGEPDNSYLTRIAQAIEQLPNDLWDQCSNELDTWYDAAAAAITSQQALPNLPGYGAPETVQPVAPPAYAAPPPAAPPPAAAPGAPASGHKGAQALANWRAQQRAGTAVPGGRARRGTTAAPAPVAAPAQNGATEDAGPSTTNLIREYMLQYPTATAEHMVAMLAHYGLSAKPSTISGTMTAMRSAIEAVKKFGHWKD